ncbi:hypothetical protein FF011L_38670 [Roseimaritima multifibrata]|uniref:Uncharacterized protein n=1 Tax=Roseimaritima multifibrata TaxID=1930274 RepID=A0A517MJM6_9BACT|nr:hypothetical protein FF011L_38670 [Roseimaritima multifibrata]
MEDLSSTKIESRWLWQTKRLFPHPVFAGCISFCCVLVTFLLAGVGISQQIWPMAAASVAFLALAYATCIAAFSLAKEKRAAKGRPQTVQQPSKPTYAVMILLVGIYSWLLTIGMHLFDTFFNNGPGSLKYVVTLAIAVSATLFMQIRGKRVVREHFGRTGGRNLTLSSRQVGYVCFFVVSLSIYFVWVVS